jgi:hypothetical protein
MLAGNDTTSGWIIARLIRIDAQGSILWSKRIDFLPDSTASIFQDIIFTSDSCYVAVGGYGLVGSGESKIFLYKFDINGNTIWSKLYYPDSCNAYVTGVYSTLGLIEAKDKGIAVTGSCAVFQSNGMFLFKTDAAGNAEWFKVYNNEYEFSYLKQNLCLDNDSGFVMFSQYDDDFPYTSMDALIVHSDKNGNVLSALTLDSTNSHRLNGLYNINGKVFLRFYDAFVETNLDTGSFWIKTYQPTGNRPITVGPIMKCSNSDFVFGLNISDDSITNILSTLRTDSTGNIRWAHKYRTLLIPQEIAELSDARLILQGTGVLSNDYYTDVIVFDSTGYVQCNTDSIGIIADSALEKLSTINVVESMCWVSESIPNLQWTNTGSVIDFCAILGTRDEAAKEIQAFPVPSKGEIRLNGLEANCIIEVFNMHGQSVFISRVNDESIKLDLSQYDKGIYFVKVLTARYVEVIKIILN